MNKKLSMYLHYSHFLIWRHDRFHSKSELPTLNFTHRTKWMYILYYMRWQKLYTVHTYIKCNPYVARMTAHACDSMYRACALFYPSCLFAIVFIDRRDRFSLGRKNIFLTHHTYIYMSRRLKWSARCPSLSGRQGPSTIRQTLNKPKAPP